MNANTQLIFKCIRPESFIVNPHHHLRILVFQLLGHIAKHLLCLGTMGLNRCELFISNGGNIINNVGLTDLFDTII